MANFTNINDIAKISLVDTTRAVRNDKFVANVVIRPDLGPITTIVPSPRVLTQNPVAGVQLPRGATVNLVLTDGSLLSVGVIDGAFQPWKQLALGQVFDTYIKDDPTLTALVAKFGEDQTLSDAERNVVINTLNAKGVQLGTDTGADLGAALNTLGAANAFNGIGG